MGDLLDVLAPVRLERAEQPFPQARCLEQHEQREEGDGGEGEDGREDRLAEVGPDRERRLPETVGERLQLGCVLLDPGEEAEALELVREPAVALLHLVDHRRQSLGDMGQRIDQRVSEQAEQPEEQRDGADEHDAHRAAPSEPAALQEDHRRIEHGGDESGDEDPEDHLAEASDEPVEHPGRDHHRVDREDGAQRDAPRRGGGEEPFAPRCVGPDRGPGPVDRRLVDSVVAVGGAGSVGDPGFARYRTAVGRGIRSRPLAHVGLPGAVGHLLSMSGLRGRACQHESHGGDRGRPGTTSPVVVPGPLRTPRGAPQRGHAPRLPLRVLRGPAPASRATGPSSPRSRT